MICFPYRFDLYLVLLTISVSPILITRSLNDEDATSQYLSSGGTLSGKLSVYYLVRGGFEITGVGSVHLHRIAPI